MNCLIPGNCFNYTIINLAGCLFQMVAQLVRAPTFQHTSVVKVVGSIPGAGCPLTAGP